MDTVSASINTADLLVKGLDFAKTILSSIDQKTKYDFRTAHTTYCTNVVLKFCRARTFFVRNEPQHLDDFYVPASILRHGKVRVERANLTSLNKISRRTVITGNGGSGKTVFMRHLLLDAIERGIGYPVFIELRNLNDLETINLEAIIVQFMKDHGFPLTDELAVRSLREGLLIVLLDGFDEVVASKRKKLEREIRKLGSVNPCQIVLSSRPDMVLEGWDGFSTTRIAPLNLSEACELVEKVRFDDEDEIKKRFITHLKGGLFQSHQYFLSNPLLLSIMLFTYGTAAEIPKKFASFYEQAYAALFNGHDARKSGFKRERNTDLDAYEFSRLFSAFSAITYQKRMFRFSATESIKFTNQAKVLAGTKDVDTCGFLEDARLAVCLLIEDGLDLTYVHRSFQEFFVAKFILEADKETQKKYIDRIISQDAERHLQGDHVLHMLYEMSPAVVEENYLLPTLERFFGDAAKRKISVTSWKKQIVKLIDSVHLHKDGQGIFYSVSDWSNVMLSLFVVNFCLGKSLKFSHKASQDILGYFDGKEEISLKAVPAGSSFWRDMAEVPSTFSLKSMEIVRQYYVDIKARSRERNDAIGEIFSF